MGFFRQEYWSGYTFPSPGDLSKPETEPKSPELHAEFFYCLSHQGSLYIYKYICIYICVCIHMCMCTRTYVYVYIHMCVQACMCVYTCLYMYVCIYMYVYTHIQFLVCYFYSKLLPGFTQLSLIPKPFILAWTAKKKKKN